MATLQVSNQAQLDSAVRAVSGGDTILLSSGTYGDLTLNKRFDQKVTIASAEGNQAVITKMLLRGAANIELKNMKFDYVPGKSGDSPFWIEGARGVTLTGIDIEGQSSGFAGGVGLRVKNSQDIEILNSEISGFRNGLSVTNSGNVKVLNNDLSGMSNDAMLLGGITGMLIQGNDFRNMRSNPAMAHKDMIQFFNGSGSGTSQNIVIRGNVIDNPEESHAIFFGNNMAKNGNLGAYFRNILIEDNNIQSAHVHGITMDHGSGVTIRGNTVLPNGDDGHRGMVNIPLINVSNGSTNVTIQGNKVTSVPDARNGWVISGNDVDDRNVLHWYGNYGPANRSNSDPRTEENWDGSDEFPRDVAPGRPDGGETVDGAPQGGKDLFRIYGGQLDDDARRTIDSLDFADGDVLVFGNFDTGTFRMKGGPGNKIDVWDSGRSAKLDSAGDLAEIAALSPDVSAVARGSDLVVRITQNDGTSEIVLEDLAAAFRAADQPDLF